MVLKEIKPVMMGATGTPVEMDETFIGGKPKNMHRSKRLKQRIGMNGYAEKTAVFGMLERGTRQVRATVIPNVKRETLQKKILEQVRFGSTVYTDGWPDDGQACVFTYLWPKLIEQRILADKTCAM
jgi:hypothetical protein